MTNLADSYDRDGFAVLRQCVPTPLIAALRQDFVDAYRTEICGGQEVAETGLWKRFTSADRIWRLPTLIEVVQGLLQYERLRLWQDQIIIKRAFEGSPTEWHQDAPYWPMKEPKALTCWIPLSNVDEDSGCLRFVRTSHLSVIRPQVLPLVLSTSSCCFGNNNALELNQGLLQSASLAVGDCTFHSGLVIHGSNANRSDRARVAYKIVYMADGTGFRFQWHTATDGLSLRDGEMIAGPDFPLVGT